MMSSSSYPTLTVTIPLYNLLIDHIEDHIDSETSDKELDDDISEEESQETDNEREQINEWEKLIKEASNKCRTKLLQYYNKTNDSYLIAIILDPRLKIQYFEDHKWEQALIDEIQVK